MKPADKFLFKNALLFAVICLTAMSPLPLAAQTTVGAIETGSSWLLNARYGMGIWALDSQPDMLEGEFTADEYRKTYVRDTLEAAQTLQMLNIQVSEYQMTLDWLAFNRFGSAGQLAQKLQILSKAGNEVSQITTTLLEFRNSDGGFGGAKGYQVSNLLDTALALQALKAANYSDTTVLYQAINFLTTNQNNDGGWGFIPSTNSGQAQSDPSNAYVTATVLRTLSGYSSTFNVQGSIQNASAYLLTKQNTDGGFGSSPSEVYETALSLMALIESGQGTTLSLQNAINYLVTTQSTTNGSWNNDPYSTALALQALAKVRPNLSISSNDITYTPAVPTKGDSLTITAVVKNNGFDSATGTTVRFYDGDPNAAGVLIGDAVLSTIPVSGSSIASVTWNPSAEGVHNIFVLVDPANLLSESTRTDNLAIAQIKVSVKADLIIQALTFLPDLPSSGQSVEAQVKVANQGGLSAENVVVRLSVDGVVAADKTISAISNSQSQTVAFTLQNLPTGFHQITATVDPNNAVTEGDETNNSLVKPVEVKDRIDLMPGRAEIYFSPSIAKEGEPVYIAAVIYNRRENTANNVLVRFYDGDPKTGGTQIGGDLTIAAIPGNGAAATEWSSYNTLGKSGFRPIYAVVDPLNAIEETDESNNTAMNMLEVSTRPDLIVQDIQFTPASPEDGDLVQIRASVKNIGTLPSADSTKVKFYSGDPAAGGIQIEIDQNVNRVKAGETLGVAAVTFNTAGKRGDIQIYAVVDTTNINDEIDETNNVLVKTLTVRASSRPDLTLSSSDISFTPAQPLSGETVTISAQIHNLNNAAPADVLVRFFDGNPASGGVLIGSATIPGLSGLGTEKAETAWNLTNIAGKRTIYVQVDPNNAVPETNETNNEASAVLKLRLSQSAAPINLTALSLNATDIELNWQPGPEADAYGIVGYNVYRNKLWVNSLRNISKEGTASASSTSSSYTPNKAADANVATYWSTANNAALPHWWREDFTSERKIKKVAVYWQNNYHARNYEIQTWNGTQWVTQSVVTGNTKEITIHDFPTVVLTDKIRVYITATARADSTLVREVGVYEERPIGALTYQDKALGSGAYTYSVTGVDADGVESLPSNEATASAGDITPPAPPSGLTATVTGFNVNLSWNASTDAAGYRVYKQGLNVALKNRGTIITGTNGASYLDSLIDGNAATSGYTQWSTTAAGTITITLPKVYGINRIKMLLEDRTDNRYYRYLVESSVDGQGWRTIVDKTSGEWRGWQDETFGMPVQARYLRITGSFCSTEYYFRVMEFEAYTQDFSPTADDTVTTAGFGYAVADYSPLTEYTPYDYSGGSRKARRFVFTKFTTLENDILSIYDKDTNVLLASYWGDLGAFITAPLTATNYRFQFITDAEGTASGFSTAGYIIPGKQTGLTYAETRYQKGSYQYAVSAIDENNNESDISAVVTAVIADATPPAIPRNLSATAGNRVVNLAWTSNSEVDLAGYNLYRNGETTPLNGSAPISANSYKDANVVNLTTYTYRIAAVDINGNESAQSSPAATAVPTGYDLAINQTTSSSDVFIVPAKPTIFDTVTVSALLRNLGTDTVNNVKVNFYDGAPGTGGIFIGTATVTNNMAQNATAIAQTTWNPISAPGSHTIYAVVDPDNSIVELLKTNGRLAALFSLVVV